MTAPARRRRSRSEAGATAIVVALMATLLFSLAGLAVDMGNAWARGRAVQKQADISAIGSGYLLPQTAANKDVIAEEVATVLNENLTTGQQDAEITGTQLVNGVTTDGEVTFTNPDGTACADNCLRMTVLPPQAEVDFGFAGAMGFAGTNVQRPATVMVESSLPDPLKLMPFWLPSGCGYGAAHADTSQGGGNNSTPAPTPTETGTASPAPTGFTPGANETGNHVLNGTSPLATTEGTTLTVSNYSVTGLPTNTDRASLRFVSPSGTYLDYAAQAVEKHQDTLDVPTFTVGTEVTATPGEWQVYALVQSNNKTTYSGNHLTVDVSAAAAPAPAATPSAAAAPSNIPVGCVGQDRGNFGQLDSPRADGITGQNNRLAANIAMGIDHQLQPFVFASEQDETKDCGKPQHGFIAGAHPDTVSSSTPPRNCITGDTGNDGPAMYDGLVAGIGGAIPGRLDSANGPTTCPSRSDVSHAGKTLNNDLLSCFLRNGASLATIAQDTGVDQSMLDPAVVESPRFVWLPVVVATDRAQKDFQPILDFAPAFITDETTTSTAVTNTVNGLEIDGNSVKVLHVFTFNKDALPIDEQAPSITFNASLGNSVVRLVE